MLSPLFIWPRLTFQSSSNEFNFRNPPPPSSSERPSLPPWGIKGFFFSLCDKENGIIASLLQQNAPLCREVKAGREGISTRWHGSVVSHLSRRNSYTCPGKEQSTKRRTKNEIHWTEISITFQNILSVQSESGSKMYRCSTDVNGTDVVKIH